MTRPHKNASTTRRSDGAWGPWQETRSLSSPALGRKEAVTVPIDSTAWHRIMFNNVYQVFMRKVFTSEPGTPFASLTLLCIKRNDREPVHDWRDLQRIKNELTSPEHEAVELYPAESRKLDTANQYWLWVLPKGRVLPFGQMNREVCTPEELSADESDQIANAKQRPFDVDDPWNDSTGVVARDRVMTQLIVALLQKYPDPPHPTAYPSLLGELPYLDAEGLERTIVEAIRLHVERITALGSKSLDAKD